MDKWVNRRTIPRQGECTCRLFCFPWAGGGTGLYNKWARRLPDSIEVIAICLPGRESRFREEPYTDLLLMVKDICEALLPSFREKPFGFLGHSMGAILCFEVACRLKSEHSLEPVHMFLSAATAPYSPLRRTGLTDRPLAQLSDEEFVERLVRLGPREVATNPSLMRLFVPCIRADLTMLENYGKEAPTEPALSCPISFFDGRDDQSRDRDIESWKTVSSGAFESRILPGGHFFLQEEGNAGLILQCIGDKLQASC